MSDAGFALTAFLGECDTTSQVERVSGRFRSQAIEVVIRHHVCNPESVSEELPLVVDGLLVAYEGRIGNRDELAAELNRKDILTAPESHVFAAAYQKFGAKLSARVTGEFACVVIDCAANKVVATADSMGVRRVYYRQSGSRIWITSNLAVLFDQFPATRPDIDREVLEEYFAGIMAPWSGKTIWRGIREVGRGRSLICLSTNVSEEQTWAPRDSIVKYSSSLEVDEAFRCALFKSIKGGTNSPGPILVDLSGGYDSSTVCCVASSFFEARERRQKIFAWSYVNPKFSEQGYQNAVREKYDLTPLVLNINENLPFSAFNDTEIPSFGFIQFGAVDRALKAFAAANGIEARLTGYGADALYNKNTNPTYLADWVRSGRFGDWFRHVSAYLNEGTFSAWQLIRDSTLGGLNVPIGARLNAPPIWLAEEFRRRIAERNREFVAAMPRTFCSDARELIYRLTQWFIPPHGRILADERMPLVGRELVEFLLQLDWQFIINPNEDRVLLRRSLRDVLPSAMRVKAGRTDHGAPIIEGLRARWSEVAPMLSGDFLADLGVIDQSKFVEGLKRVRAGFSGLERQYTHTALYLETWLSYKNGVRPPN